MNGGILKSQKRSNPNQSPACNFLVILKTLISFFRCDWLGLELNSAGHQPSRTEVAYPWCRGPNNCFLKCPSSSRAHTEAPSSCKESAQRIIGARSVHQLYLSKFFILKGPLKGLVLSTSGLDRAFSMAAMIVFTPKGPSEGDISRLECIRVLLLFVNGRSLLYYRHLYILHTWVMDLYCCQNVVPHFMPHLPQRTRAQASAGTACPTSALGSSASVMGGSIMILILRHYSPKSCGLTSKNVKTFLYIWLSLKPFPKRSTMLTGLFLILLKRLLSWSSYLLHLKITCSAVSKTSHSSQIPLSCFSINARVGVNLEIITSSFLYLL